jgi:hypothetical protein
VAEPPPGQTWWPATPCGVVGWFGHPIIFLLSLFLDFFLKKIKYVMGAFWKKEKKKKNGQNGRIATI